MICICIFLSVRSMFMDLGIQRRGFTGCSCTYERGFNQRCRSRAVPTAAELRFSHQMSHGRFGEPRVENRESKGSTTSRLQDGYVLAVCRDEEGPFDR